MTSKIALPVRTSSPLSFNLWDHDREPVLYITAPDVKTHTLELELGNTSEHAIAFEPIGSSASGENHHLALRFQRGTLSEGAIERLRDPSGASVLQGDGWVLAPLANGRPGHADDTTLYFLYLGSTQLELKPGERRSLFKLRGLTAAPGAGSRRTNVELAPKKAVYRGHAGSVVSGVSTQGLSILNHSGAKHAPLGLILTPATVRPGAVAKLTLQLQNLGRVPLTLGQNSPARFELSFAKGDAGSGLAAADSDVQLQAPVRRSDGTALGRSSRDPGSQIWVVQLDRAHELAAGDAIHIELNVAKVGDPGTVSVTVQYYELHGFQDGSFAGTVEKSAISQASSGAVDIAGELAITDRSTTRIRRGEESSWAVLGADLSYHLAQIYPNKLSFTHVSQGRAAGRFALVNGEDAALSISQNVSISAPTWGRNMEATLFRCRAAVKGRPEFYDTAELEGSVDIGTAACATKLTVHGDTVVKGELRGEQGLSVPDPDGTFNWFKVSAERGTEVEKTITVRGDLSVTDGSMPAHGLFKVSAGGGTQIRGAISGLYASTFEFAPNYKGTAWGATGQPGEAPSKEVYRDRPAILRGLRAGETEEFDPSPDFTFRRSSLPGSPPQIVDLGTGHVKTFIVNHPQDDSRYLVHATLEGPENAVYYRGTARLDAGRARVELPSYFEALTRREGRTVHLTNVDGFDRLAIQTQEGEVVKNGAFVVASADLTSNQAFCWEVKAVRRDVRELAVEPLRSELQVQGFGPYTYGVPAKSE